MGYSSVSLHITYKKNMTNIEECKIDVTVINDQKMKFGIKGTVHIKLQVGETVKLNEVLYAPQAVNIILSVSRLVPKGSTMGDTKDKITIDEGGVNVTLDTRKGINESTIFYLKANRYAPEGSSPQEAYINMPE